MAAMGLLAAGAVQGQQVYELSVPEQPKVVKEGHLKLGGVAPDGGTSFYFRPLRKDAPFLSQLPNVAELDFSKGSILEMGDCEVVPQYQIIIATGKDHQE